MKINKLFLLLLLLFLTVGVVSAADNNSTNNVLSVDLDLNNNVSIIDNSPVIYITDDTYGTHFDNTTGKILDESNIVTNNTFFFFFDENGTLKSNETYLTFQGEFSNLGVDYIKINKPIDLYSNGAILNNIAFDISSDDVLVRDFGFNINTLESAIRVLGDNVTLTNNNINYNSTKDNYCYGIQAEDVNNLTITDNTINFIGATEGNTQDTVVMIENGNDITLSGNKINAELSSVPVNYIQVNGTWVAEIMSQAVAITGSNININNNDVNVKSNRIVKGSAPTIYNTVIKANDVNIENNNFTTNGEYYTYALSLTGDYVVVNENNVTAICPSYYAGAISINAPFNGDVINNNIKVQAVNVTYGIFDWGNVNATYENNTIVADSNSVYAIEACGNDEKIIGNTITATGNYTLAIAGSAPKLTIEDNIINITGQGFGKPTGGDVIPSINSGIYLTKYVEEATVSGNKILANIPSRPYNIPSIGLNSEASNVIINNNEIEVNAINGEGSYDSIYGAKVIGDNSTFKNNKVTVNGLNYTYGLTVGGEDVLVEGNNITAISPSYYAGAVNVYSPFNGDVINNNIKVQAVNVTYGIFDWGNVNATYENNTIVADSNSVYAIEACGNDEKVIGNTITATGNYTLAIAGSAPKLTIEDNIINITGQGFGKPTGGDVIPSINSGIYLTNYVEEATVSGNKILANIPSTPYNVNAGGIIIDASDVLIDDNIIIVSPTNAVGSYDSIYGVKINGDNVTFKNNILSVNGLNYAYGIKASADDNLIDSNNIFVISDSNYACGINLECPYTGTVKNNNITAFGNESVYGIYSSQWSGNTVVANYTNNNILVNGKTSYGMELMGETEIVDNNNITANGQYTMGIATSTKDITIENNNIISNGTETGSAPTMDMFGASNQGILILDKNTKANINNNAIKSNGDYGVNVLKSKNNQSSVTNNYLIAKENVGNAAVNNITGVVANNTPKSDIIVSDDVVMYYKNGTRWVAVLTDSDGKPISGAILTFTINGVSYNRTTNANGMASIAINLDPNEYDAIVSYKGQNSTVTKKVSVNVLSTIEGNDTTLYYRNGTKYNALFLDKQGNPLKNTKVTFNINGVMYERTTDENGLTSGLTINLNPGTYIITATNPTTNQMYSNNITVLPTIITSNVVKYYKNGTQFEAKALDKHGNALAGQKVTFNINGVFYTKTTNADGIAILNINLAPEEYIITTECNGCTVSNTVNVLPVIIGEDTSVIYGKGGKFNVKVLDGQGNPQEGVSVTFNINGVMYHRTSNADGTTSGLSINLQPGEYIITSSRDDNGATISNKVTVTI